MTTEKKKIVVALSGGVDSSVSAALLQKEGHDVTGVFIKTWTAPWLPCTWREERRDAMRVAAHLHISFHTIDLSKEYERDVVQYLVREYRAGRTPNPDVMCNKYIKFGGLFDWALEHGFDAVATGHYARVEKRVESREFRVESTESGAGSEETRVESLEAKEKRVQSTENRDETKDNGEQRIETKGKRVGSIEFRDESKEKIYQLLKGKDKNKDQSYFLWTLGQHHLEKTLFPIGEYEKPKVRELATSFGLPTATKKDSQGVCFLGKLDMKEFLSHYIEGQPGEVVDTEGAAIGTHDGAYFYTLGQRHGFTVTHQATNDPPLYVVAKDVDKNTITVSPRMLAEECRAQTIRLTDVNWTTGKPLLHHALTARLRYRQPLFEVSLAVSGGDVAVTTTVPQPYVPYGQSLVMYDDDTCLGGGVIEAVE